MPDFLCENVGEMLVVLDDNVRFWFYSGILVYPRIYTVYSIYSMRGYTIHTIVLYTYIIDLYIHYRYIYLYIFTYI